MHTIDERMMDGDSECGREHEHQGNRIVWALTGRELDARGETRNLDARHSHNTFYYARGRVWERSELGQMREGSVPEVGA